MADVAMRPSATAAAPIHHSAPLDQSDAIASLLSLSFAEGGQLAPAKVPERLSTTSSPNVPVKNEPPVHHSIPAAPASHAPSTSVPLTSSLSSGGKHHRRLSSTGKTRRRLSDAREAANRPSPSLLQSTSGALSLATLSLSSSPPSSYPSQVPTSFSGASRTLAPAPPKGANGASPDYQTTGPISITSGDDEKNGAIPIPISSNGRTGKKRGMDHRCESCSKIYRHPSCLIKHRWEHTPHWREASKFVLSKHQQVQLLEAAAILSHMSPAASGGRSLPDDRSLWPSFLSGGSLPPPEPPTNRASLGASALPIGGIAATAPPPSYIPHPIASSVPAGSAATGPRLHDYGVRQGVVTQVRPGLIGVTTSSGGVAVIGERPGEDNLGSMGTTQPVPVPNGSAGGRHYHDGFGSLGSTGSGFYRGQHPHGTAESWGSYGYGSAGQHGLAGYPYSNDVVNAGDGVSISGGWSLPKSSVRSGSSRRDSRSRSRSVSNDGDTSARNRRRTASGSSDSPPSDDDSVDGMIEDDRDTREREVNIVIEEEEGDEEGDNGVIAADRLQKGTLIDDGKTGPVVYGGGRYPQFMGRNIYPISGRRPRRLDDDDEMGRNFALREEDEEMDDADVGRIQKGRNGKREEEWDGMEMEMDMDMD